MFDFLKKYLGHDSKSAVEKKLASPDNKQETVTRREKASVKEDDILFVMEKTMWDYEFAKKQMDYTAELLGISSKDYVKYSLFDVYETCLKEAYEKRSGKKCVVQKKLPVEQLPEEKKSQGKKEKKENSVKGAVKDSAALQKTIDEVMEKTDWSYDYARKQIKAAKSKVGISYTDYRKYNFFKVPEDQQEAEYQKIVEKKQKRDEHRKRKQEKAITNVMKVTGWDHDYAEKQILEAQARTGCTHTEYYIYRFYEKTQAEQDDIFVGQFSRKITAKYDVDKKFNDMLYNKEVTNQYFAEYVKRPWCRNTNVTFEEFRECFAGISKIFYKPLGLNGGRGAAPFTLTEDNMRAVYDELVTYPEGVVEKYVVQHPKMNAMSPTAVNTIRIVTISSKDKPIPTNGEKMDIAYASLKMGGVNSIVDNLHGGGVVAAIDLETGKLITDAVDGEGKVYTTHPATGTVIKGFEVPMFKEAVAMVTEAIEKKNIAGYLGWDIAVTEDGPMLIEVNVIPGVILLTMPYLPENRGMKPFMARYLED